MRYTMEEKLKMVEEHVKEGKSLSHISERYNNYSKSTIKYLITMLRQPLRMQITKEQMLLTFTLGV